MKKLSKFGLHGGFLLIGILVLGLLFYFLGFIFVAGWLTDHPLFPHQNFRPIYDWDLPAHSMDLDLDGDQKKDLISFTGCAFLSSQDATHLPASQQCTARGVVGFNKDLQPTGQKFISSDETDLDLGNYSNDPSLGFGYYAYLYENNDQWFLVVKQNWEKAPQTYQISNQGLNQVKTPLLHHLHTGIYEVTLIMLIPLFLVVF